jgi:hypothetical protein
MIAAPTPFSPLSRTLSSSPCSTLFSAPSGAAPDDAPGRTGAGKG